MNSKYDDLFWASQNFSRINCQLRLLTAQPFFIPKHKKALFCEKGFFASAPPSSTPPGRRLKIDQNRILSNQLNIAPMDDAVFAAAQKSEQPPAPIYDQRRNARCGKINLKVADTADSAACF